MPTAPSPQDTEPALEIDDRARVIATARQSFAEHGFTVSDEAIAAAADMPLERFQRLAPDRAALIEAVIAPLFAERWHPEWSAILVDRTKPLAQRLAEIYVEYRERVDRTDARLWTWAGLAGAHASGRISGTLTEKLLAPIIGELRHECGLRGFSERPLCTLERELAQALHGAIAFVNTRRFVFGARIDDPLEVLVPMIVRAFLPGAREELERIHRERSHSARSGDAR